MPRIPVLAAIVTLGSIVGFGQTAEWHQWRGLNRDGRSTETGLLKSWPAQGPPLAWHTTGAGVGFSSFSSADGRLYTLGDRGDTGFVIAFDAATGKGLGDTEWPELLQRLRQRPARHADDRRRPALRAWGNRRSRVSGHGNRPGDLAQGPRARVRKHIPEWGYSESPLVVDDRVIVHAGGPNASIVAVNKLTGATLWRSESDRAAYSSGVLARVGEVTQAVYFSDRRTLGVDTRDGRLLWSYDRASNRTANIATPVVSGTRVLVSSDYDTGAGLLELSPSGAREVYFTRNMRNHYSSSVLVGDYVTASPIPS